MFIFIRFKKKKSGLVLLSHKLIGVEVQNYTCYDHARNLKFNMKKCVVQKYIGNSAKNSTQLLMPAVFPLETWLIVQFALTIDHSQ